MAVVSKDNKCCADKVIEEKTKNKSQKLCLINVRPIPKNKSIIENIETTVPKCTTRLNKNPSEVTTSGDKL